MKMYENCDIKDYCNKCGRTLRNGRCDYGCGCDYGCDSHGNNNNQRIAKAKLKPQHKCYYCDETENLETDCLPGRAGIVYFCPLHFQWNFYSHMNKKFPDKFRSACMKGLIALVKKMKEKKGGSK